MSATSITVRVPLAIKRRPGRKTIVTPTGETIAPIQTRADPALLKALARAFRWQKMLDEGRYASISELARAEKIERGYLGKMLQLTLLPPAVVEAIVAGRQRAEVGSPVLMGERRWDEATTLAIVRPVEHTVCPTLPMITREHLLESTKTRGRPWDLDGSGKDRCSRRTPHEQRLLQLGIDQTPN